MLAVLALLVVELTTQQGVVLASAFVVPPLVLALFAPPGETAAVAALSALAAAGTLVFGRWEGLEGAVPLLTVGLGGAAATAAAFARANAEISNRELSLLAAVGEIADMRAGLAETVRGVTDLAVPELAETCCIDAIGPDGMPQRVAVSVADHVPRAREVEEALMRRRFAPVGSGAASQGGKPVSHPSVVPNLEAIAASPEDLELLYGADFGPGLFLPLYSRGRRIGVFSLIRRRGATLDRRTRRFAEVLSGRVALALDNAGLSAALSGVERRLDAIVDNLDEAVTVQDLEGRTTYANAAAARLLGCASPAEVLATPPEEMFARFEVTDEDGRPLSLDDLPSRRLLNGEEPEPVLMRNVVRATGEERWLLNRVTALRDEAGELELIVSVSEDVTEAKSAERGQRLLAEIGGLSATAAEPEEILAGLVELLVPDWAEWCEVALPRRDGIETVAVAHADPEQAALGRGLRERRPSRPDLPGGLAEVLRSGAPIHLEAIGEEEVDSVAQDPDHAEALRALGLRSMVVVPLRAGPQPIGALVLSSSRPHRFGARELALAEEVGRRAGFTYRNAQLYAERAEIAATLQGSLLPRPLPSLDGWDVASFYRPVGEANDVGGDFYEGWRDGDTWTVVVGDVAGKGARAAALTSLGRHTLRAAARLTGSAAEAFAELNAALAAEPELSLCTAVAVRLPVVPADGRAVARIACAGHPRPVLLRGGEARWVEASGPMLGSFPDLEWEEHELPLEPGDVLLLYTDGVLDVVGANGERFGEERLLETMASASGAYAGSALATLDAALDAFTGVPLRDDSAAVAIAWEGVPARWEEVLPRDPSAPKLARASLAPRLAADGVDQAVAQDALLLLSELVTNAVRHGGGEAGAPVVRASCEQRPGTLRVEVRDPGAGFERGTAAPGAHGGFGLDLVARTAAAWGIEADGETLVWFELAL